MSDRSELIEQVCEPCRAQDMSRSHRSAGLLSQIFQRVEEESARRAREEEEAEEAATQEREAQDSVPSPVSAATVASVKQRRRGSVSVSRFGQVSNLLRLMLYLLVSPSSSPLDITPVWVLPHVSCLEHQLSLCLCFCSTRKSHWRQLRPRPSHRQLGRRGPPRLFRNQPFITSVG